MIIKFLTTIFFLFLILAIPAIAQTNYEDVVYLKNGSVIHGMIIEQIPNESIKIKTADKNIFVFKIDEILKITKEEIAPQVPVPIYVPVPSDKSDLAYSRDELDEKEVVVPKTRSKGYVNILEFTFGREMWYNQGNSSGSGNTISQLSIGVQDIHGYRFNRQFSTGIGFGLHLYPGLVFMPLFADFRFHFNKHGISPFVNAEIGYTFTQMEVLGFESSKDYFGGLLVNPAIGVRFPVKNKFSFIMSFGYRYQEVRIYAYHTYFHVNNQEQALGYLNTKVGFEF